MRQPCQHPSLCLGGAQTTLGETQEWDWLNPRRSLRYLFWAVTAASGGLGALRCDAWEPLSVALLAFEACCCGWSSLVYLFSFFFSPCGSHSFCNTSKEEGVWGREHPPHQTLSKHGLSPGMGMGGTWQPPCGGSRRVQSSISGGSPAPVQESTPGWATPVCSQWPNPCLCFPGEYTDIQLLA